MGTDNIDRIAVIIPVYDVTSFLEEAVRSAVVQDYAGKEVIVVDDGASEEAAAEIKRVCKLFGVPLLHHSSNEGPTAARHTGLAHTSGKLVIFLDGDDILLPGALRYFAEAMCRNPSAVATYARTKYIDAYGEFTRYYDSTVKPPEPALQDMASGSEMLSLLITRKVRFSNGAICFRREALKKVPSEHYNLKLEDLWILSCHLALLGEIVPAGDRIVLHRRMHAHNLAHAARRNPSLLFPVFDRIYADPTFITAIGREKLGEIRRKIFAKANFHAATTFAEKADTESAATYFNNLNMPLSLLFGDIME